MKLAGWSTGLLSIWSLLSIDFFLSPVVAQCVQADISVQYNISGSRVPTERTNDVDFQSDAVCQGNVSVTTGVQGNIGGNRRVRQTRKVRHRFHHADGETNQPHNTIQIKSNPAIDVYNAADNLDY
ncbi:MAG: hypothetical protein AAGF83_05625 [Cyanobacteria bacterium P01_G01_bin.67]